MNILKYSIIIICISVLIGASISVTAVDENPNDVLHWKGTDWHNWNWNVDDRPNVDITDLSYTLGSDRLTISMTVKGSINTAMSLYHIWFNSSDAWYHLAYIPDSDPEPVATAFPTDFDSWTYEELLNWEAPETDVSIEGSVLSATIDWVTDDHTMVGFYGYAQEWGAEGEQLTEFWIDYAPNDFSPYGDYEDYYEDDNGDGDGDTSGDGDGDGTTGDTSSKKTPGFEIITLMIAITLAVLLLKRRK